MKRSYEQNCALANALDLVGERWTLLIVRELLISPKRYKQLADNLPSMGTNLLAARLKDLSNQGLIENYKMYYQLTPLGQMLDTAIYALIRFGLTIEVSTNDQYLHRAEWDSVALQALYRPDSRLVGRYVIELDGNPFSVVADGKCVSVSMGYCESPIATVAIDKTTGRQLVKGDITRTDAISNGKVKTSGSRRQASVLLKAFGLG